MITAIGREVGRALLAVRISGEELTRTEVTSGGAMGGWLELTSCCNTAQAGVRIGGVVVG